MFCMLEGVAHYLLKQAYVLEHIFAMELIAWSRELLEVLQCWNQGDNKTLAHFMSLWQMFSKNLAPIPRNPRAPPPYTKTTSSSSSSSGNAKPAPDEETAVIFGPQFHLDAGWETLPPSCPVHAELKMIGSGRDAFGCLLSPLILHAAANTSNWILVDEGKDWYYIHAC